MGELIELGVHRAKRNGEYVSNEEARMIRGFIGWKLENKRAMDARDDAIRAARADRRAQRRQAQNSEG